MRMILAAAGILAASSAQAAEPSMGASDPATLYASLQAMGCSPEPLSVAGAPSTIIVSQGQRFWVVLGGCDEKKACKTLMVGATYTDVVNPPLDWINRQNESYDLIKVWINKERQLAYSAQMPTLGVTRPQFRTLVDSLTQSARQLGQDALEAKLVK